MRPEVKAATLDQSRVSTEGVEISLMISKIVEPEIQKLVEQGEPDERCATCAFKHGTIPSSCHQTMLDAVKCLLEGKPFHCHAKTIGAGELLEAQVCHGWYAARQRAKDDVPVEVDWEFSQPD
jgi:hypothetical protein